MNTNQINSLLDELSITRNNKHYYVPAVVFGYLGYRHGFETEIYLSRGSALPFEIPGIPPGIHVEPFKMALITIVLASLANGFFNRGETDIDTDGVVTDGVVSDVALAHDLVLFFGLMFAILLSGMHLLSLEVIYVSEIYTETLLGLAISIYQVLIAADAVSSVVARVTYVGLYTFVVKIRDRFVRQTRRR